MESKRLVPCVLMVCVLAAGCGAAQLPDRAGGSKASPLVTMTDGKTFEPSFLEIRRGATVVWKNTSRLTHTVTADPSLALDPTHVEVPPTSIAFDSGEVQPGGMYSHRFDEAGLHRYVCLPWESEGMSGAIRVSR